MIKIVLVDDHALIRQALARALKDVEGFEVVGEAGSAEAALDLISKGAAQVVLMDISMPGMGGLKAAEAIHKQYPGVNVLMLTIHDREDYLYDALRAGARGYILKGAELDELIEAIQTVSRGDVYIYQSMMPKLVSDYLERARKGGKEADELSRLSAREREVLTLIAEGHSVNEIADRLVLSTHTVRRHREHIMSKLNLHSTVDLVRFAVRRGIAR